jgi:hypothetical protein
MLLLLSLLLFLESPLYRSLFIQLLPLMVPVLLLLQLPSVTLGKAAAHIVSPREQHRAMLDG